MSIRPASLADSDAIAAMLGRLAEDTGDGARFGSTPETIRTHGFGAAPLFETLIAEAGGAATGFALFFRHFSTTLGQPGVFVQDLWVAPEARGDGLGARLLAATIRHARASWGAAYLLLTRHAHNTRAGAFYARLGFTERHEDVQMLLSGDAFDSLFTSRSGEAIA